MAVITISRQYASGGDEIARRVSELLGYQLFDKRQIARVAREVGLSEQEIIDYSEDQFKVRGFFDRLLGRSQPAVQTRVWKESAKGERVAEETQLSEETALTLVQQAVLKAYEMGNFIIVGRGGQVILKDKPGVLHVRIESPLEYRIQFLKEQIRQARQEYLADLRLRREAQDIILERDAASAEYIRRFYHVEWDSPYLYHVIFNTARLTIEQTARFIARLAAEIDELKTPEGAQVASA